MGELSKKVGEAGESLVEEFLKLIGWGAVERGVQLTCAKPEKHKTTSANRQTHGIDFLFSYKSPLIDEVLQNVWISAKFSSEPYLENPRSKFKDHFSDLTGTLECFKSSELRQQIMSRRTGFQDVHDVGVLIWLSNAKESYNDLLGRIETSHVPDDNPFEAIYVVDNKRIAFIYDSVIFARKQFPGAAIEFYYHETGRNMNPLTTTRSGAILPAEFITSSVLAFRVEPSASHDITLLLFLNDPFTEDALRRMIGLAQSLSGS